MISNLSSKGSNHQKVNRQKLLVMLQTGLDTKAYRFTRQTALSWLTSYPGDLEVNLFYARALVKEERFSHAVPVIQKILRSDPEYLQAALLSEFVFARSNPEFLPFASGMVRALGGSPVNKAVLPAWGDIILKIRQCINQGDYKTAQEMLFGILSETEHVELVSIAHLQIANGLEDQTSVVNLARLYHSRLPECIQITLSLAKNLMENAGEDEAVSLLHSCAAGDPAGQVPLRLWGSDFPYKPLYPQEMVIELDQQIPAEVAGKLGMNQLGTGKEYGSVASTPINKPEVTAFDGFKVLETDETSYPVHPRKNDEIKSKSPLVKEIDRELRKVAEEIGRPVINNTDERFPAHVILSLKSGLKSQFGEQSSLVVIEEMKNLAKVIETKVGWSAIVFLPDELEICGKYNITPVDKPDPWKIKLALVDLDKALAKTGERIGSVMIVGGDKVVPFHRLPNPTDDADADVPSDSPYGALDTNYFVSDWAVGRVPGEDGMDAGLLLSQLRNITLSHQEETIVPGWINSILRTLFIWDRPWLRNFSNIGYTASVWRRSSLVAFRPVGEGRNLYLSPNGSTNPFDSKKLSQAPIGYFNVHGVEDGSEWYGQKDPLEGVDGPDFPVALKPSDLKNISDVPSLIYCEACYGGHIFGKKEIDSIALTLLGKGVLALIGSTTISYGSITSPLIGADLFGFLIMKFLRDGLSVGSAMVNARVEFVREMNRRQGYLDGEDQKTLISFVLYGDPLASYDPYQPMKKVSPRELSHPMVKTISDSSVLDEKMEKLAPAMVSNAKKLVKDYLPGIEYAEVRVRNQHEAQFETFGKASKSSTSASGKVVVSFNKQVTQSDKIHKQYARVTMDKEGKAVKIAVSR